MPRKPFLPSAKPKDSSKKEDKRSIELRKLHERYEYLEVELAKAKLCQSEAKLVVVRAAMAVRAAMKEVENGFNKSMRSAVKETKNPVTESAGAAVSLKDFLD